MLIKYVSSQGTMRNLFLIFLAILPLSLCCQVISIITLDKQSLEPIPNAEINIQWNDSLLSVKTDLNGRFKVSLDHIDERDEMVLSVQHPMYDPQTLRKNVPSKFSGLHGGENFAKVY